MINSTLSFILVLGVLIFFHEFGHFLIARLFGVGVEKFSLGFGPRLFGFRRGITDYRVSAIPLGGYVKMVGEDAEVAPEDIPLSFTHKHVFKRMFIVAAGPVFNILLAVMIFFGIFFVSGTDIPSSSFSKVVPGLPAELAGLESGDRVTAIDGREINDWSEMVDAIDKSEGRSLSMNIQRPITDDTAKNFKVDIRPVLKETKNIFGEKVERYIIGVNQSGETYHRENNLVTAAEDSLANTYKVTELMVIIVAKLITGAVSTDNLGGPIMIAQMAGDSAKAGVGSLLGFIALISINLAIVNLLPIPVLDGGHLLFFSIEAIKGSPVSRKVREIAQDAGLYLLILLMVLVFYNDITRIFFK